MTARAFLTMCAVSIPVACAIGLWFALRALYRRRGDANERRALETTMDDARRGTRALRSARLDLARTVDRAMRVQAQGRCEARESKMRTSGARVFGARVLRARGQ